MTAEMCRICLESDVRMHEISDSVRDVYEKLTNKRVRDGSPHLACYICYQQLRNCLQLVVKAHRSEELLKQISTLNKNQQTVSYSERQKYGLQNPLIVTSVDYLQIVEHNDVIKTEDNTIGMYEVKIEFEPEENNTEAPPETELTQPEKCMEIQTTTKQYKCEYCSYNSIRKSDLTRHVRIHTNERPYSCPDCPFQGATTWQLKVHLRSHSGERPFKCPHCDCSFIQSSSLKIHVRTHTGEKPYSCYYCNYKCSENGTLKAHIRTHTGEKPFKCPYCNYTCKQSSNLNTHIRTHTGGKPYNCTYCSFTCGSSSYLKTHIRTHTGEKPYACEFCDKRFTGNSGLKKHMRIHENGSTENS